MLLLPRLFSGKLLRIKIDKSYKCKQKYRIAI